MLPNKLKKANNFLEKNTKKINESAQSLAKKTQYVISKANQINKTIIKKTNIC